jgi:foldase protein PrsA
MKRIASIAMAVCLTTTCGIGALCLSGCGTNATPASTTTSDGVTTTEVAAKVNDVEISEAKIDEYIASLRASDFNLEDDAAWQSWLEQNGYTEESLRERVIDLYIDDELIAQDAEQNGVSVSDTTVEDDFEKVKENYDSDEAWQAALKASGYTEDQFRDAIRMQYLSDGLKEKVVSRRDPTDEELQQYVNENASSYNGKRFSVITIDKSDSELAQTTLTRLQSGEDFAAVAREVSTDEETASNGGDMGWTSLNSDIPSAYTDALATMNEGDISGIIETDTSYAILKCTGVFTAPEQGDVDETTVPDEIMTTMRSKLVSDLWDDAFDEYVSELRTKASIIVYGRDGTVIEQSMRNSDENVASTTSAASTTSTASTTSAESEASAASTTSTEGAASAEGTSETDAAAQDGS